MVLKPSGTIERKELLTFIAASSIYGNLGLFVGAGFSKAVLNDKGVATALSWGELLAKTAAKMNVDYDSLEKTGVSFPEIASAVCDIHSKTAGIPFTEALRQLKHAIADLTSWYPTQEQRKKYSAYLKALRAAWIITTNYDLVIESLLTGESVPLGPNDPLSSPDGVVPVFHLHGVRTNPEEIIIAQQDYVTLFRPSEYRQIKLALTIKESTTLFLGYALGDVNVLTALDWSRNVFKGEQQSYPNDVIQVLRVNDPSDMPYRDRNGIVIIETAELSEFFEEFNEVLTIAVQKKQKERESLKQLADMLNSPDTAAIDKFIDDGNYRRSMLEILSKFSVSLISSFVSFLEKCIDETWERSAPRNAFEGYNQNLVILLDILTAFPLQQFPPALFQTAAYGLDRVAYYVGSEGGKSWSAENTWNARKGELPKEIVKELGSVAEQYNYWGLEKLLESSSVDK